MQNICQAFSGARTKFDHCRPLVLSPLLTPNVKLCRSLVRWFHRGTLAEDSFRQLLLVAVFTDGSSLIGLHNFAVPVPKNKRLWLVFADASDVLANQREAAIAASFCR